MKETLFRSGLLFGAMAALYLVTPPPIHASPPLAQADCLECHSDKGGPPFKASIHGGLGCTDCHTTIKAFPHAEKVDKVACGTCHAASVTKVAQGVHAKSSEQPCLSCHGDAHQILPVTDPKSTVYPLNIPRTCGTCHADTKMTKPHNITEV